MKKNTKFVIAILIIVFSLSIYFLLLFKNDNSISNNNEDYEGIAMKFISQNDPAFVEDGYELQLDSKEKIDEKNIKMIFLYKLYSYPEGDKFRVEVIINTETGSINFVHL